MPWLALVWLGFAQPAATVGRQEQDPEPPQVPQSQESEQSAQPPSGPVQEPSPAAATGAPEDLVVRSLTVVGPAGKPRIVLRCDDSGAARIEVRDAGGIPRLSAEVAADGTAAALLGVSQERGLYGVAPPDPALPLSLAFLDARGKPRMVFGLDKASLPFAKLLDKAGLPRIGMRIDELERGTLEVKDDEGRVEGGIVGR